MACAEEVMLQIREEQFSVFSNAAVEDFVCQMIVHLRRTYPELTKARSDGELAEDVRSGIDIGERYGFREHYDLKHFLECRTELGADMVMIG